MDFNQGKTDVGSELLFLYHCNNLSNFNFRYDTLTKLKNILKNIVWEIYIFFFF